MALYQLYCEFSTGTTDALLQWASILLPFQFYLQITADKTKGMSSFTAMFIFLVSLSRAVAVPCHAPYPYMLLRHLKPVAVNSTLWLGITIGALFQLAASFQLVVPCNVWPKLLVQVNVSLLLHLFYVLYGTQTKEQKMGRTGNETTNSYWGSILSSTRNRTSF